MSWYEKIGFGEDPYKRVDPPIIPFERIEWNRVDLGEERGKIDDLIEDIKNSYKVALLVYGPYGSGKTWLSRVIEKEILSEVKDALFIRTKIYGLQPNFSALYDIFIRDLISSDGKFLSKLESHLGTKIDDWVKFFKNNDLANALYQLALQGPKKTTSLNWLLDLGVTMGDLKNADITAKIGGDAHKYEIMKLLIEKSAEIFPLVILNVDELENANRPSFARQVGDVLRDLLDVFYERFVLLCSFSAESVEVWYDYGYSEALARRLNYIVKLDTIKREYAPTFLRKHQEVYRKKDAEIEDQLSPFTEEGIDKLIEIMEVDKRYPGYVLPNCGILARDASKEDKKVDAKFVIDHQRRLEYIATQRQLL